MSGAAGPGWPSSRALAGWWPQLAPLRPSVLWLWHLHLHHVEAAVGVARPGPPDPLDRAVALALRWARRPVRTADLAGRLHLDRQLLGRVLTGLASAGLAREAAPGEWEPAGADPPAPTVTERRVFHFADPAAALSPRFLALRRELGTALLPEGEWRFDVSVLAECLARPAAWKREHGFPEDVRGLAAPAEGESVRSAWARVLVDRPEQLMGLAVQPADEENVVGFAVPSSGGPLRVDEPAFRLSSGWRDEWPELTAEPTTDAWREAWREWGHSRNLAAGDLEACRLEPSGVVLRVSAPGPFLERLRATRSDVFKSDTWLLAGTGSVRRAALIELVGQP